MSRPSAAEKATKNLKEKYHTILRDLVAEPENKTCADCLAKGPRWSSWSLGVFLCIRCAGIHRNLGTHISKVKSVDLDSWSTEQIQHILCWGNRRASDYFECFLPSDFVRPQGNSAVESFIRSKYERKLYIMKDGEPTPNDSSKIDRLKSISEPEAATSKSSPVSAKRRERPEKKKVELRQADDIVTIAAVAATAPAAAVTASTTATAAAVQKPEEKPALSILDAPAIQSSLVSPHVKSSSMNDLLSLDDFSANQTSPMHQRASSNNDLLNFAGQQNTDLQDFNASPVPSNPPEAEKPSAVKSTKESIMSLYGTTSQQSPSYGIPGGMYMPPTASAQTGTFAATQGSGFQTPPQGGFQTQPGNFQGQQGNFQGQQGNFQGQQGNFQGQQGNFQGQQGNFQGQQGNFQSQQGNFQGQQGNVQPRPGNFQGQQGNVQPRPGNLTQQGMMRATGQQSFQKNQQVQSNAMQQQFSQMGMQQNLNQFNQANFTSQPGGFNQASAGQAGFAQSGARMGQPNQFQATTQQQAIFAQNNAFGPAGSGNFTGQKQQQAFAQQNFKQSANSGGNQATFSGNQATFSGNNQATFGNTGAGGAGGAVPGTAGAGAFSGSSGMFAGMQPMNSSATVNNGSAGGQTLSNQLWN